MKLLDVYYDSAEADRVCNLLEEKGIPVFIQRPEPRSPYQYALFVCLDPQFEDAQTILKFPSHSAAEPVDAAQFHRDIDSDRMKSAFDSMFMPGLIIIAISMLLLIAVIYFVGATK